MTTRDNSQANENRGDSARQAPTDGSLVIRSLVSHVVRAPTFIVRDWRGLGVFPVGATVVAGKQGSGKSTFLRKILSDFTSGSGSFRGEQVGNILYTCWEDDPGESILPEVAMNGGDLGRIHFLTGVRQGSTRRQWQMDDLERIENYCAENPQVKIIVVDTLTSLSNTIGRNTRGARAAGMVTTALHQLGQRLGIAVVIVCHLTKYNRRGGALDAIAGSTELTSGPRAVWLVGRNPRNESYRSMVLVKHNLTGLSDGCTFATAPVELSEALATLRERGLRTEGELPQSMFLRTEILHEEEVPSADAVYQASVNIGSETRVTALDQAVAFIRTLLSENGGCVATSVLQDRATLDGFSAATLLRARNKLREDGEIQTFQRGREHFVAESGFDPETLVLGSGEQNPQVDQPEEGFGGASPQNTLPPLPPGGQYERRIDF